MAAGRIQCLLISTVTGHVVYERFYDAFTEMEKAHIRESFDATVIDESLVDNQELVGRFKNGRVVAIPSGDLLFFGLGTGEYNELALCEVVRTAIGAYLDVFKVQALTASLLFQNWAQTILVMDELCKEGLVEHLDRSGLQKALSFKPPSYSEVERRGGGNLMSRLSTV